MAKSNAGAHPEWSFAHVEAPRVALAPPAYTPSKRCHHEAESDTTGTYNTGPPVELTSCFKERLTTSGGSSWIVRLSRRHTWRPSGIWKTFPPVGLARARISPRCARSSEDHCLSAANPLLGSSSSWREMRIPESLPALARDSSAS